MMKKVRIVAGHVIWFMLLTLFTQIGGLIWILVVALQRLLPVRLPAFRWWGFLILYLTFSTLALPPLARLSGRVPLPVFGNGHLKPENILFAAFNRHYVHPELRSALIDASERMQAKYPGVVIRYMDACFPLIDGYPLEPHFSHRDGRKVDLAFFWRRKGDHSLYAGTPSPIGYGVCIAPVQGEYDYNKDCEGKGYWYISLDKKIAELFFRPADFVADEDMSSTMVRILAEDVRINKMLLQTHLEKRWGLAGYDKIRQQGCRAARHDDHVHVEE
jgi:hypothetical protein